MPLALRWARSRIPLAWRRTAALGSTHATPLARTLLVLLREIGKYIEGTDLQEKIERGLGVVETLYPWEDFSKPAMDAILGSLVDGLEAGAAQAGEEALLGASPVGGSMIAGAGIDFHLPNEASFAWARDRSMTRVTAVTEETKASLRRILIEGFQEGRDTLSIARRIREGIGLTPRQSMAVSRYRAMLETAGTLKPKRIEALVARYHERSLKYRARMIARTEVMAALNRGHQDWWEELTSRGKIDESSVERVWMAADDDLVCEVCQQLHGTSVGLGEEFLAEIERKSGSVDFFSFEHPPAHPLCRCRIVTRSGLLGEALREIEASEPIE